MDYLNSLRTEVQVTNKTANSVDMLWALASALEGDEAKDPLRLKTMTKKEGSQVLEKSWNFVILLKSWNNAENIEKRTMFSDYIPHL